MLEQRERVKKTSLLTLFGNVCLRNEKKTSQQKYDDKVRTTDGRTANNKVNKKICETNVSVLVGSLCL